MIAITSAEQIVQFNKHLKEEHYLGASPSVGDFIRQVAIENAQGVTLFAWSPAVKKLLLS